MMCNPELPALYRSTDQLSRKSQGKFFATLSVHLAALVTVSALSLVPSPHWIVAVVQLLALLLALSCSIYLFNSRPDRLWYRSRAVAESIKTMAWRYLCCAEPFNVEDEVARSAFSKKLRAIADQHVEVRQALTDYLDGDQITSDMATMRSMPLADRIASYATCRIDDQLRWYAHKAKVNARKSTVFFSALIVINALGVISASIRMAYLDASGWPTDLFVTMAAGLLTWMQAKRFSELAASYAVTASDINLVKMDALAVKSDDDFSVFVGDAENAFSREHSQWVARKDI